MSHLLIVNDDGVESPALLPLARALAELAPVEVVVPDRERSWVSKAITRYEPVHVERVEREGISIHTTTGFPADCTQLGVHSLFDHPPLLVVSGINVGFNQGSAYMLSSGTVGAAVESWISGVPALAFHAGTSGDWPTWARWARSAESLSMWERLAAVSADIVATLLEYGFPAGADIMSINLPEGADLNTPRRVVAVARVGYDRLFASSGPGAYTHEYGGRLVNFEGLEGTDIEATRRGEISITPIRLPHPGSMGDELRAALERQEP